MVTSRERMDTAMHGGEPDRVPVMCQLSLGHYFVQAGLDPVAVWHDSVAFGEALVRLQRRYGFDGILVNLPGRPPDWERHVRARRRAGTETVVTWSNGFTTVAPDDDNPHVYRPDGAAFHQALDAIDPDRLFYVEPHDVTGTTYPTRFGFTGDTAVPGPGFFPPYAYDTVRWVVAHAGAVSIHAEVFSPFSQLLELLGYEAALLALLTDPGKVRACLDRLAEGAITYANGLLDAGADAILVSSAFAGAPFLSRGRYADVEVPSLRRVVDGLAGRAPVYLHTCGAIGDRLDLMMASGVNGIDTLDPPPLGTVDLASARLATRGRVFLKGNLDPVGELLQGTPAIVLDAARERIAIAGPGGGYVLSSACSVAPRTPPEHVLRLLEAAQRFGTYPLPAVDLAALAGTPAGEVSGAADRTRRRPPNRRH